MCPVAPRSSLKGKQGSLGPFLKTGNIPTLNPAMRHAFIQMSMYVSPHLVYVTIWFGINTQHQNPPHIDLHKHLMINSNVAIFLPIEKRPCTTAELECLCKSLGGDST